MATFKIPPKEALLQVIPDLDQLNYVSEMITDEKPADYDSLYQLIQDFLLEQYSEKESQKFCKEIIKLIVEKKDKKKNKPRIQMTCLRCSTAF